ncbi:hypothetical protein QLX67_10220 [Balneolaceae bacterium ANBcel3]|nr:hypothetical protein [Balneolaceae bacterium ANBcel3]
MNSFISSHLSKIIIYISVIFLMIGLYMADYMVKPRVHYIPGLFYSVVFLWTGFIVYAVCWGKVLGTAYRGVGRGTILASSGLSIFGKYIPGRLWLLLGRSAYIEKHSGHSLAPLSLLSLKEQIISVWTGFFVGITGYLIVGNFSPGGISGAIIWFLLTPILFGKHLPNFVNRVLKRFIQTKTEISPIERSMLRRTVPYCLLNWMLWSVGFYFLVQALVPYDVSLFAGLCFPLAANIGLLAFFAPGGIGVRETMIIIYLNQMGVPVPEATTISLASRLWFLSGEAFIFVVGNVAHLIRKDSTA